MDPSFPPEPARPRLKWHVVYYLLAAFDILTVTGSLVLNDRVTDMYVQAVASNEDWGQLMADYTALEQLAGEIDASGNDIFESRDPVRESRRIESALAAFSERLAALRKDLLDTAPAGEAPPLLSGLADLEGQTRALSDAARDVIIRFGRGEREEAARRMAAMDRRYATLLGSLRDVRIRFAQARRPRPVATPVPAPGATGLGVARWQRFERQTAAAASLQRWEFVIALLIVMMVTAAVVYGRTIAKQMEADGRERARYIAELREARETLENRVLERTEALQSSEERLRRAAAEWQESFEAIESPVLLVELDGRVVRANRAAAILAVAPPEALLKRPMATLGPGEPWTTGAALVGRVPGGGALSTQVRDPASGRTWDVSVNAVVETGRAAPRAIVVARDVTRTIQLQEAVRREETMAVMGSLVAGVAHEVRNPLFGISATLDAFQARVGPREGLEKYFTVLKNDVARLQTLMRDLLDYGKPARVEPAPVSLETVVAEAVRACAPPARGLHVTVDVSRELPCVSADRPRLVQVFQNLLQNALQHAPAGSAVHIEAGVRPNGEGQVWCSVRDLGPGFRPEDLPHLFEPFFTRRPGGTGLGLSIAQRIVEQHGGTIRAGNHPDGGGVVTVVLPRAAA
jgi:signal transduction histidine kinase